MRCVGNAPPVVPMCCREDKRERALSMRAASMLGAKWLAMRSRAGRMSVIFFKTIDAQLLLFELRTQALAGIFEQKWLKMHVSADVLLLNNEVWLYLCFIAIPSGTLRYHVGQVN